MSDWRDFQQQLETLSEDVEQIAERAREVGVELGAPAVSPDGTGGRLGSERPVRSARATDGAADRSIRGPLDESVRRAGETLDELHRWFHEREQQLVATGEDADLLARNRKSLHKLAMRWLRLEKRIVASPSSAADERTEVASTGVVSGIVSEDGSGAPIEGVMVELYAAGAWVDQGLTGADGSYSVAEMEAGDYQACTVNESGYFDERYDDIRYLGACVPGADAPIAVTSSQETGGIDFGLSKGGTVSGVLTVDGTTTPIAGVFVDLRGAEGDCIACAITDDSGRYTTSALTTGAYYACTENTLGFIDETWDDIVGCVTTSGMPIAVVESLDTAGIDFGLAVGGSIAGTVEADSSGLPIEGVTIDVYDSSGSFVGQDATAFDGTYEVDGLATGTYYACTGNNQGYADETYDDIPGCVTTSGTPISVTEPSQTGGIDFGLSRGGTITGTVTEVGTGTPLSSPNVVVEIRKPNGAFYDVGFPGPTGSYQVTLDESGTFYALALTTVPGLHEDELYHNIPCPGGNTCTVASGTPILVSGGNVNVVDFGLRWLTGCMPNLLLDGPPIDDVGLVLEGCDTVTATGPFGVLASGSITIRAVDGIAIGNGFFVEDGASCVFELVSP